MWLAIGDAVEHWARYYPHKTAIIVGDRRYSYREFWLRALSVGSQMKVCGATGSVAVAVRNKFDYLACLVGLNRFRFSAIVINVHESAEAQSIHFADTNPNVVICDPDFVGRDVAAKLQNPPICIEMPNEEFTIVTPPESYISEDQEWGILFSSGSTGISKAIIYDHRAMTSELLAWCLELGIGRNTRFYIGRPVCYTGGLVITFSVLLVGGSVVMPVESLDDSCSAIWQHYQEVLSTDKLDYAFFVPDQLRSFIKIAKEPIGGPTILVMGAPITGREKQVVNSILRSPVIESWGNTEGLGTITDREDLRIRPDSIGRPFLTERLWVMHDNGTECPMEVRGRLAGHDETMFKEYANRPETTEKVKRQHLVFSDDIGYMDAAGYFYIVGRDQEQYIVDGKNVFLGDLDESLRQLLGISEACVLAYTSEHATKFRALVVTPHSSLDETLADRFYEVTGVCLTQISQVTQLPRLASGKLDRISASKLKG